MLWRSPRVMLLAMLLMAAWPVHATTYIWTGLHPSSGQWSKNSNWVANSGPSTTPIGIQDLVFGGLRVSNINDITGAVINSITFSAGASGFDLNGNQISLINDITNLSSTTQTISLDMSLEGVDHIFTTTGISGNMIFSGVISGILSPDIHFMTKAGIGTLYLTGANTYNRATVVNEGVLNIQNATALGNTNGGTSVAAGAALEIQGGITVGAEDLTLNGTGVSNGGALRSVSGNNTYGGLITLGSATRINSDTVGTTLTLSNTGTITGATFDLTVGGAGNTSIASIIGTTSGTLTKDGTGTLTLTAANTYTGLTTVSAGVLNIQNAATLGTTASGTSVTAGAALEIQGGLTIGAEALTLNGTGISNGGALRSISGNNTYDGLLTLGSAARINSDTAGTTLTLSNAGTITGATLGLTVGGAGNTSIASIIGTTSGTLTKDGTGTLTLTAANTHSGVTTLSNGTLALGNVNALQNSTLDTTTSSGTKAVTFTVAGTNTYNLGGLAGADDIAIGANSLSIGANNQSTSYGGILSSTGGGLTKLGTGTLTLTNSNTYTGATTVSAGTLALSGSGLLADSSAVNINGSSAVFDISAISAAGDTIGSLAGVSGSSVVLGSKTLTAGGNNSDTTFAGVISGSGGNFTKSGTGKTTLTGTNTYTGTTTVNAGTLQIDGVVASAVMVNSGATLSGAGSVSKAITINGVGALLPGNKTGGGSGIGTFTLSSSGANGNLTVASSGSLGLQLGANGISFANQSTTFYSSPGVLNSNYTTSGVVPNTTDRIVVGGTLSLTGGSIVDVSLSSYTPALGDAYDVLDWATLSSGGFLVGPAIRTGTTAENALYNLKLPDITAVNSNYRWDTSLFASNGILVVVPEPSRGLLFLVGLAVWTLRRSRRVEQG